MGRLDPTMAADLVVFAAAADAGSFTEAAGRLGVTQGAVSQRVARLEKRLGIPLFHRGSRRLVLTGAGAKMAATVIPALESIREAIGTVTVDAEHGRLRVSCSSSLALDWLGERLVEFGRAQSDLAVELLAEDRSLDAAAMQREGIDVAIRYDIAPASTMRVHAELPSTIVPVCATAMRASLDAGDVRTLVRLNDAQAWCGAARTAEWDIVMTASKVLSRFKSRDLFFNLSKLAVDAAVEGGGVAIGRRPVVDRYLAAGLLVPATDEPPVEAAHYFCFSPRGGSLRPALTRFIDFICEAWPKDMMVDRF